MRLFILPVATLLVISFTSCKKNNARPPATTGGTKLVRLQQGTDPSTDTVFKFVYNGDQLRYIYDSILDGETLLGDTLFVNYNASGRIADVTSSLFPSSAIYSYNASGQLIQLDQDFGQHDRFQYSYSGDVVSQEAWYTDGGSGTLQLYQTFKFTVTDGNITEMKTYDKNNILIDDVSFIYGAEPNPFKELSLLNVANILGVDNFAARDTYFNKNTMTGFIQGTSVAVTETTFNSDGLPVKVVSDVPDTFINFPVGLFTWQFSYK